MATFEYFSKNCTCVIKKCPPQQQQEEQHWASLDLPASPQIKMLFPLDYFVLGKSRNTWVAKQCQCEEALSKKSDDKWLWVAGSPDRLTSSHRGGAVFEWQSDDPRHSSGVQVRPIVTGPMVVPAIRSDHQTCTYKYATRKWRRRAHKERLESLYCTSAVSGALKPFRKKIN